MEIKFDQQPLKYVSNRADQVVSREETMEVRISDAMPAIGRVIGCWGHVVTRGKEWREDGMSIQGGVQAQVLYEPEDGGAVQSVEAWVPFQHKWQFAQTQHDGFVCVVPTLKAMDARSVSARKLMLRVTLSTWGRAMEMAQQQIAIAPEMEEDLQLLVHKYPMELGREYGEKRMVLDEETAVPDTYPQPQRLIRQQIDLQLLEQKVLSTRLVMKGTAKLQLLYFSDGRLCTWKTEFPVAMFADLEQEHSANCWAKVWPLLTNLDIQQSDGKLNVKAEFAVQYLICDRVMVQIAQDAYSTVRSTQCTLEQISLPAVLEESSAGFSVSQSAKAEAKSLVDVFTVTEHPVLRRNGNDPYLNLTGQHQILYEDLQGKLQSATVRFEENKKLDCDDDAVVHALAVQEPAKVSFSADSIQIVQDGHLDISVESNRPLSMVTQLTAGEKQEPDPGRPCMIIQRCGDLTLWELAKQCGSTVEAICRLNQLEGEPDSGKMLLIPVN